MQFSDETLMAFADGELPDAEAAQVQIALSADRRLAVRVERFRNVRRALRATYDSVADEPIPDHLRALLGDVATHEPEPQPFARVIDLAEVREQRRFTPPVWAALAASVLVGVLVGRALLPTPEQLVLADNGQLRAGATLARVLDQRLQSAPENGNANVRVGLSFRDQDGRYCRTFNNVEANNAHQALSGLACREPQAWVIQIATSEYAENGMYRQAASAAPAVLDMVDALIAGEPLDPTQERAARAHDWRAEARRR